MKCIKSLLTACLLLCVAAVSAHDFEVDGIYYNITDATNKTVAVTYSGSSYYAVSNEYTGSVVIPESVTYGKTYSVTSIGDHAFYGCSGLTSVEIPNSVTSIGDRAFVDCSGLTSITISNSVTSIGDYAFVDCSGLTSIEIPNSVTSIGGGAFRGCSGLTSIEIPNSVVSIGEYAFDHCSGLKEVHINDLSAWYNISFGGYYANPLSYAENLYLNGELVTDLVIPDNVKEIKDCAFSGCSGLTSIEIPNSVTSIGNSAFSGCSGLTSIVIPNSVTSIGDSAFSGCSGLTSIVIPNSVTSIGDYAFCDCSGLTSIVIPNSVTSIGGAAFRDCSGLTSIEIPNSVTSIGNYAFDGCSGLTSITIPNSVTGIGNNAFDGCSGLTSIVIPNSVTSIGDRAFINCSGLTSIIIPNSVTSIEYGAFSGCSGLTSIEIPNSVTSIGNSAFSGCSGLTSITIPNSVTSIEYDAFSGCSELTSIEIPNSVTSIGNSAFDGCSGLTSITIPNSVTGIGNNAFDGCSGLTSIVIPNSVTSIGDYAFWGCSGLTSIVIPNSVTSIGKSAFGYCSGLTSIVVEVGNKKYDSRENCNAIIETESNTLIAGCMSTIIPNSVTSIGDRAFVDCSGLTSVTIHNSVTSIGIYAFYDCSNLKTVINLSNLTFSKGSSDYGYVAYYADKVINAHNGVLIGDFVFSTVDDKHTLVAYFGDATDVTLPGNYNGENYAIGDNLFNGNNTITSVTIPNSVTSIGHYAFQGCSGLTSIIIPNSVVSIGESAFHYCGNLKTVTNYSKLIFSAGSSDYGYIAYYADKVINYPNCSIIGDLVFSTVGGKHTLVAYLGNATEITLPDNYNGEDYTIGEEAFYNCKGLTSIEIPNSVTGIGNNAFNGCSSLTNVTIPNSITSIGDGAFSGCLGLKTVVNLSRLTLSAGSSDYGYIAYYADKVINDPNCSIMGDFVFSTVGGKHTLVAYLGNATEITLPDNYNGEDYTIGEDAFYKCSGLTSIEIPNSVTGIGNNAFNGCSSLTNVTIGNGVTSIGNDAFKGCTGLTSIEIPNSVTSIGNNAFNGCSSLTSVTIPNSVVSIGDGAFSGCLGLKTVVNLSRLTLSAGFSDYGYIAYYANKVINAPSGYYDGDYLWAEIDGTKTLAYYLGDDAELILPENCEGENYVIGSDAFYGCSKLERIEIPNSVVGIGNSAFEGCSALEMVFNFSNLIFHKGSTGCGYVAYYADKVINAHNGSIEGDFVFGKPDGASTLVAYLGSEIELVLPVDYGGENYVIGDDVFSHCSELENLTIPCRVTNIGNYAFNGCTSLKELCIEDGEEALVLGCNDAGKGLFYDCPLEILYVGRTLSYEKDSLSGYSPFYGIETLASVGIGTSDLDENLFDGCLNINNVGFNTEVAPSIFANHAKVTDVTLSGRVKLVSDGAFAGMDKLTNVVLETPVPPAISSVAFEKLHYKLLYVYLLDGCTPIYQASEIWKNFLDIQEFIPDGAGVCEAANVWRNYWDIPEYSVPEGEIEESVLADVPQLERVSDGVRLPNAKGKRITVYTFSGSLIKNVSGYSGETIALDKGTYIIVADNDAMKVVL